MVISNGGTIFPLFIIVSWKAPLERFNKVCMYACMQACMHARMHVCMYVCMYVESPMSIFTGLSDQPHPWVNDSVYNVAQHTNQRAEKFYRVTQYWLLRYWMEECLNSDRMLKLRLLNSSFVSLFVYSAKKTWSNSTQKLNVGINSPTIENVYAET